VLARPGRTVAGSHIVAGVTPQEYVEEVLALIERIPAGRVMSYGAIADALADASGRNSARLVGNILARHGGGVPWHRVVNSSGRSAPGHEQEARRRLLEDGVPLRGDHVDMRRAGWNPAQVASSSPVPPRRGSPAAPPKPTPVTPPK
jgi:methylated-DNA-protein-cysteine methyltransferase-like protein